MLRVFFVLCAACGGYALCAQVYFFRELMIQFGGNELCLGSMFVAWFLGVGTGALCAHIRSRSGPGTVLFQWVLLAFVALPPVSLALARLMRPLLEIPAGGVAVVPQIFIGTLVTVVPTAVATGLLFPLACHIAAGKSSGGSRAISTIYIWDAGGSLAAGLAISLLLIQLYEPLSVLLGGAAFICACSLTVQQGRFLNPAPAALRLLCAAGLLLCCSVVVSGRSETIDQRLGLARWNSFETGQQQISACNSPYQHLTLAEAVGQYGIYTNGSFWFSYPDETGAASGAHLSMLQHPRPRRILLVGGLYSGQLKYILQHDPEHVDCIELDPALALLLNPVMLPADAAALQDQRVHIHYGDGRGFISTIRAHYDLIIVSAPEPSTAQANRYYTRNFYQQAARALAPGGVLATRLADTAQYISEEEALYAGSMYHGLGKAFEDVLAVPGYPNRFFAADDSRTLSSSVAQLQQRFRERNIQPRFFDPVMLEWLMPNARIAAFELRLQESGDVPVNTDMRPVTYVYSLITWEQIHAGRSVVVFLYRNASMISGVILVCLAMIGLGVFFRGRNRQSTVAGWAVMTTGCSAMAVGIILLFMFQTMYGALYHHLGIFTAVFMTGLVGGAAQARKRLRRHVGEREALTALTRIEALLCCYLLCLLIAAAALLGGEPAGAVQGPAALGLLLVMMLFAGLFAGLQFPPAAELMIGSGCTERSAAARCDAMDHFGACLGAAVSGLVLVPFLGITGSCLWLIGLKAVSLFMALRLICAGPKRIC